MNWIGIVSIYFWMADSIMTMYMLQTGNVMGWLVHALHLFLIYFGIRSSVDSVVVKNKKPKQIGHCHGHGQFPFGAWIFNFLR
jgi:hypothetical protein